LHDRGPPEALLLAIRAARRALSVNPDDAGAFLLMGEAYFRLSRLTRDGSWQATLSTLADIRRAQTLTALEQAVRLRPDLDRAHELLFQLYYEAGQMDRALDHVRERLRIAQEDVKQQGRNAAAAEDRQVGLKSQLEDVESRVARSLEIYLANTEGKTDPTQVLDRARVACRHGLTRKALEMLLDSHLAIFGKPGAELQLDLMLQAGRAFEVRAWLDPEHEEVLGSASYHSFQAQAAAACGDYAGADAELDNLAQPLRLVQTSRDQLMPVRSVVALRVSVSVLARPAPDCGTAGLAGMVYQQFDSVRPLAGPAALMGQEADVRAVRGLLATESGDVITAREHFRAALSLWGSDERAATGAGLDFLTRPFAQQALRRLEDERED
jgi:tetratricopeptide (TPR) repeat protein